MSTLAKYPQGNLVTEGKTQVVNEIENNATLVRQRAKDDITAGDGAKHDIIPAKGQLATETTCNVFELLKTYDIPVAFVERDDFAFEENEGVTSFIAQKCQMLPYEVVVRREAHGSYLKRNPHLEKGHLFPELLVEFFLKTKNRGWGGWRLICDDPLMIRLEDTREIALYDPACPIQEQKPFLILPEAEVFSHPEEGRLFASMADISIRTFLVLEEAWESEDGNLVDFKLEFGLNWKRDLLLADVINNDSWRVVQLGAYIDKQVYRDGGSLEDVAKKYRRVAEITRRFLVLQ